MIQTKDIGFSSRKAPYATIYRASIVLTAEIMVDDDVREYAPIDEIKERLARMIFCEAYLSKAKEINELLSRLCVATRHNGNINAQELFGKLRCAVSEMTRPAGPYQDVRPEKQ